MARVRARVLYVYSCTRTLHVGHVQYTYCTRAIIVLLVLNLFFTFEGISGNMITT